MLCLVGCLLFAMSPENNRICAADTDKTQDDSGTVPEPSAEPSAESMTADEESVFRISH